MSYKGHTAYSTWEWPLALKIVNIFIKFIENKKMSITVWTPTWDLRPRWLLKVLSQWVQEKICFGLCESMWLRKLSLVLNCRLQIWHVSKTVGATWTNWCFRTVCELRDEYSQNWHWYGLQENRNKKRLEIVLLQGASLDRIFLNRKTGKKLISLICEFLYHVWLNIFSFQLQISV